MFNHPDFDGHERVVFAFDEPSKLRAIVALHDTALGPAFGGCRMWPYADTSAALTDVLRLARGMTFKAAICELPYGGGKSVIIGDPSTDKTPQLLSAMGRLVESFGGRYVIADDVGTTLADLAVMRTATTYTAAATEAARAPLPVTAYGVLMAIEATVRQVFARTGLDGLEVAVQGLGNVGMPLCAFLHERGATVTVADIDPARVADAVARLGAHSVPPEEIHRVNADIFAPCALGGILNDRTISELGARAVCGGANNQLLERRHDGLLAQRGIVFVPDYLASAGGVVDFHQERIDDRPSAVLESVERIREIAHNVLRKAQASGITPLQVADAIVAKRLTAARLRLS